MVIRLGIYGILVESVPIRVRIYTVQVESMKFHIVITSDSN